MPPSLDTWLTSGSYILIFIAMFIEGPIVTAAAAFAASLGALNIFIIIPLSITADLTADAFYYWLGHFARLTVVERWGKRFKLTPERIKKIEHHLHTHKIKTIIGIKMTPFLALPGLLLVGATGVPFSTFVLICLAWIVPQTVLFTALGYYSGTAYQTFTHYYEYGFIVAIILAALGIGVYFGYKKLTKNISKKLDL